MCLYSLRFSSEKGIGLSTFGDLCLHKTGFQLHWLQCKYQT